jgi:hypothetical protein
MGSIPVALDLVVEGAAEQVVIELVVGGQSGRIDRTKSRKERKPLLMSRIEGVDADIGPAVVVAAVAERRREGRVLGQLPFPGVVEQCREVVGRGGPERRHAEDEDERREAQTGSCLHIILPKPHIFAVPAGAGNLGATWL